jgi:hypothetical protein
MWVSHVVQENENKLIAALFDIIINMARKRNRTKTWIK